MATKAPTNLSKASRKQLEADHEDMIKFIDLKYTGIVLTEQDYLQQKAGERITSFIDRISKIN